MRKSANKLSFYFNKYETLKSDISELQKAYEELEHVTGVISARHMVLNELNKKRAELESLKNTTVLEEFTSNESLT